MFSSFHVEKQSVFVLHVKLQFFFGPELGELTSILADATADFNVLSGP